MKNITLYDFVQMFKKNIWIFVIITSILFTASIILNYLVLKPIYSADAKILFTLSEPMTQSSTERITNIVSEVSRQPIISIDTFVEQATSETVLSNVVGNYDIPAEYSIDRIREKISAQITNNPNIIQISAQDNSPEIAAMLANAVGIELTKYAAVIKSNVAANSMQFAKNEMEKEKSEYDRLVQEYTDFISSERTPQVIESEITSYMETLTELKKRSSLLEIDKKNAEAKINSAELILEETPQFVETENVLISDMMLYEAYKESENADFEDIFDMGIIRKDVNSIYVNLMNAKNSAKIEYESIQSQIIAVDDQIVNIQNVINDLQKDLAEKKQGYDEIVYVLELSKQTYDSYYQQYKESNIMISAELGRQNAMIISEAHAPGSPFYPNKKFNIALSILIGILSSIVIIIIKEYFQYESKSHMTESIV